MKIYLADILVLTLQNRRSQEDIEKAQWLTRKQVIAKLPLMYGSIAELTQKFFSLKLP
ncbi:MAG: hypothetical protein LBC49_04695 [Bacteroidales bacterium]|jgi:hypothetical protein|nr:hypothetical protein [Bacteroidales bacterium]